MSVYRILKNFAKWRIIYQHEDLVDTDMMALYKEFKRSILGKAVSDERVVDCIESTEQVLPLALARPFIEEILPPGNKV